MPEFLGRETRLRRRWSVGGRQAKRKMLVSTFRTGGKRMVRRIIHARCRMFSDDRPIRRLHGLGLVKFLKVEAVSLG
jgi:hypothetical protein